MSVILHGTVSEFGDIWGRLSRPLQEAQIWSAPLKSAPLCSNPVRSARAGYETFYKLESEYPLTVLATPPLQNDSKPCLHYLATCQLLPQASASAPPSMLLRIRKAFCSRLAERPKNVCAALQHTQQTIIRRKYSGTLFQDALDGGGHALFFRGPVPSIDVQKTQ